MKGVLIMWVNVPELITPENLEARKACVTKMEARLVVR